MGNWQRYRDVKLLSDLCLRWWSEKTNTRTIQVSWGNVKSWLFVSTCTFAVAQTKAWVAASASLLTAAWTANIARDAFLRVSNLFKSLYASLAFLVGFIVIQKFAAAEGKFYISNAPFCFTKHHALKSDRNMFGSGRVNFGLDLELLNYH